MAFHAKFYSHNTDDAPLNTSQIQRSLFIWILSFSLSGSFSGGAEVDQRQCVPAHHHGLQWKVKHRQTTWMWKYSKSTHCDGKVTNQLVLHMNSSLRILLSHSSQSNGYGILTSMEDKKRSLADFLTKLKESTTIFTLSTTAQKNELSSTISLQWKWV